MTEGLTKLVGNKHGNVVMGEGKARQGRGREGRGTDMTGGKSPLYPPQFAAKLGIASAAATACISQSRWSTE